MGSFKYILVFTFYFLIRTISFAQTEKIDSLKKALPLLSDSARVNCLNELSEVYIKFIRDTLGYLAMPLAKTSTLPNFSNLASYYATVANDEALKINYVDGIAESLSYKAEIENLSENFPAQEKLCREAINWYRKTPNKKRLAETHLLLGFSLYVQSFFTESIKNLDTAFELHKKHGNKVGMFWTHHIAEAVYHESGNYEKAFELAIRNLELANNNEWFRRNEIASIGWSFQNIEDYETALEYFRIACVNAQQYPHVFAELFTLQGKYDSAKYYYNLVDTSSQSGRRFYLTSIGEFYFAQGQYDKALPNFTRGLIYHQQLNDRNPVMRSLVDIAKTYLTLGNDDSAFKYANESLGLAKQTGAKQFIRDGCEILSTIYDHWHQPDSAYFYYRQYTKLKDYILNNKVKGKLAAYTFEQRTELLNKEKQIQRIQLQKQYLLRDILIGSIIILLLLAGIIFRNIVLRRRNEKQQLEHKVELQQLEIEKTKAEFQHQTTELEMQALRAQMNPHFIFNSLNSINRFILQNDKAQASEYLTKFSRLVRLILQNSQAALIPLESELEALKLYLELEAVRFNHHFEYKINVDEDLDVDIIKVPPLIIQPYAENAIWHGLMHKEEKGHLEIELFQSEEVLCCKITDDGVGGQRAAELKSKSASTHKSMGMRITADRIAMLQQKKQIDTTIKITDLVLPDGSAAGTEVLLKIPVML